MAEDDYDNAGNYDQGYDDGPSDDPALQKAGYSSFATKAKFIGGKILKGMVAGLIIGAVAALAFMAVATITGISALSWMAIPAAATGTYLGGGVMSVLAAAAPVIGSVMAIGSLIGAAIGTLGGTLIGASGAEAHDNNTKDDIRYESSASLERSNLRELQAQKLRAQHIALAEQERKLGLNPNRSLPQGRAGERGVSGIPG